MRGSAARRIPSNISLRLLQVVHRHGDRAPTFNPEAFSDSAKTEAKRWSDVLAPSPSRLSQDFPVTNPNHDGAFDEGDTPWGCLTSVGAYQCLQRGRILRRRYHRFLFADGASLLVTAASSNFVRTQLSAQHVLAGLLPRGSGAHARAPISITVEPAETGVIAVFDSTRPLMQLVRNIMAGPDYTARDEKLAAVAAALTESLPYFSGRADPAAAAAPPRFMWIRAADYFWAYESHGLEPRAATLREQTTAYLEWRFRRLFADPQALALASGGLLAALAANMRAAVAGAGATTLGGPADASPQLALFSGHDATLMPLVTALLPPSRAVLVARAAGSGCSGCPGALPAIERTLLSRAAEVAALARDAVPWPAYASAVSLELHFHAPALATATASASAPLLLLPSAVNGQDNDAASLAFRASASACGAAAEASLPPTPPSSPAAPWAGWRLVWSFDTDILTVDGARAVQQQQQQQLTSSAAAVAPPAPPSTAADSQLEAALLESAHAVRPLAPSHAPAAEVATVAGAGAAPLYPRPALPEPGSILRMTGWMPLADFLATADAASAAMTAAAAALGQVDGSQQK